MSRKKGTQRPCATNSLDRGPGRAPRRRGMELLGPSGSHYHLWGQADAVVIEQSVLGLALSHPPVKPSPCDHIPQGTGNGSREVTLLPSWQRKTNTERDKESASERDQEKARQKSREKRGGQDAFPRKLRAGGLSVELDSRAQDTWVVRGLKLTVGGG